MARATSEWLIDINWKLIGVRIDFISKTGVLAAAFVPK
jgi:hypothetical protein